ncbi:hypothetical protein BBP40_009872 [Aspergillus hancockii]|nr:hypothetical protein BBP40_009872 [Aspergillus hancockii]
MDGVNRYYSSLETHVWWPFSIRRALIAVEDHLFRSLRLSPGACDLDAGCGDGQVAIHLAQKGLRIHTIDVLPQQNQQVQQNVRNAIQGGYHHLQTAESGTLDGVHTIETLVHAIDLDRVLSQFYRSIKPWGRIAFYEYDHWSDYEVQQTYISTNGEAMDKVRLYGAISSAANWKLPQDHDERHSLSTEKLGKNADQG